MIQSRTSETMELTVSPAANVTQDKRSQTATVQARPTMFSRLQVLPQRGKPVNTRKNETTGTNRRDEHVEMENGVLVDGAWCGDDLGQEALTDLCGVVDGIKGEPFELVHLGARLEWEWRRLWRNSLIPCHWAGSTLSRQPWSPQTETSAQRTHQSHTRTTTSRVVPINDPTHDLEQPVHGTLLSEAE